MAKENTRRLSLAELKTLNAEKQYVPTRPDAPEFDLDEEFWQKAHVVFPAMEGKEPIKIRIDREILSFFKSQGKGYQTRMNAVLRAYVESQKKNQMAPLNEK
ncbi:MAG TPA: hypothetical protein ENI69_02380 [Rhodospirillales bacterium]|nr:hypothetical protein [Rhodospirillales bacterium]